MASSRADVVAEILWELKRAGKVAKYSVIATRAGFSAGAQGRALMTCLRTVRRDWPHLHWWRAIQDSGLLEKGCEQEEKLREAGFVLEPVDNDEKVEFKELEVHLMSWEIADGESESSEEATDGATSEG